MNELKEVISDFEKVYIQPHDNPDADAIASAYGMQQLVQQLGQQAEIIYGGTEIRKPNLSNMVKEYKINLSIIGGELELDDDQLLLVVDAQYEAGNITKVQAENIVVLDHHLKEESGGAYLYEDIQPQLGSCSTLIVEYFNNYNLKISQSLATVLYFGIFMDTDSFTGKMTVLDDEKKNLLEDYYDKQVFDKFRLSTLTFEDIKICAEGMLNTQRYENILFSKIERGGDNLLGHISDLLSEVAGVDIVLLYSSREDGFKLSVRSYHDYITAQEIAVKLVEDIGEGGGHPTKAGGFIQQDKFEQMHSNISFDIFIRTQLLDYYRNIRFLETSKDNPFVIYGKEAFFTAEKKENHFRYLNIGDYFKEDITVKTLEGIEKASSEDKLIIGIKNEVWPIDEETFYRRYEPVEEGEINPISDKFLDEYGITLQSETKTYRITKENIDEYKMCKALEEVTIKAMQLEENIKIRTAWGDLSGNPGDYLVVIDQDDYYIVDGEIFNFLYEI